MTLPRTVLVVDDDDAVRRAFVRALRRLGWETTEASDGSEALALYRAAPPTVVLSDLMMPNLDGIGLLRAIHALDPDVPFVLVTGYAEPDHRDAALNCGASEILPKPCAVDAIRFALEKAYADRLARL